MIRRFEGLDGLRGIAALIVVLCHSALIFQAWAGGPVLSTRNTPQWAEAVQRSPLQVMFAGGEAVVVFFILSGFVLMLPFMRLHKSSWTGYYPKRLVRLYLPIVGAVALSAVALALFPRNISSDQTWWVNGHNGTPDVNSLIREAFVLAGTGNYNSVLWSLKWEVVFSLLLPLYVFAAMALRRWWVPAALGLFIVSALGDAFDNGYLEYLPMFGIGVFLATGKDRIIELASQRPIGSRSMFAAGVLLSAVWIFPDSPLQQVFLLGGCTALVVGFLVWPPALKLSRTNVTKWLGSRSFSLYLVHEPIIVSASLFFPGSPWIALLFAWPVAFIITEIFFRVIEEPSRIFANKVGSKVAGIAKHKSTPPRPQPERQ